MMGADNWNDPHGLEAMGRELAEVADPGRPRPGRNAVRFNLRDIPEPVARRFKAMAAEQGVTLGVMFTRLVEGYRPREPMVKQRWGS